MLLLKLEKCTYSQPFHELFLLTIYLLNCSSGNFNIVYNHNLQTTAKSSCYHLIKLMEFFSLMAFHHFQAFSYKIMRNCMGNKYWKFASSWN